MLCWVSGNAEVHAHMVVPSLSIDSRKGNSNRVRTKKKGGGQWPLDFNFPGFSPTVSFLFAFFEEGHFCFVLNSDGLASL